MNDDRKRLDDILAATVDAVLIAGRGRAAFDGDPLAHWAATSLRSRTESGSTSKTGDTGSSAGSRARLPRPDGEPRRERWPLP